jgi:hypothetical protein
MSLLKTVPGISNNTIYPNLVLGLDYRVKLLDQPTF